jgi:hypothetical protein
MRWLVIIAVIALVAFVLHRLALAAEDRGLIYYRQRPPRVQSLGTLESLVQPSVEYMIEEQSSEAIRADQAESGQGDEDADGYRDTDGSG